MKMIKILNEYIDESTKLDKLILKDCKIVAIEDIKRLKEMNVLKVSEDDKTDNNQLNKLCYKTSDGQEFDYLKIAKEPCFDMLKAGVTSFGKEFCTLQLSVWKDGIKNLEGNSVIEYFSHLEKVKEFLKIKYGILIDFSEAKLKSLEVNRTFKIKQDFNLYSRVLRLILSRMPYMKSVSSFGSIKSGEITNETFTVCNKKRSTSKNKEYKQVTYYDKSKQLRQVGFFVADDYMRFELKIYGERNISHLLKVAKFTDLTQEDIDACFNAQVDTLITKPLKKWRKERDREVKNIFKQEIEKGGNWVVNALRRFTVYELEHNRPLILDIEEACSVVDKLHIADKARVKRRLRQQALKYERIFTNNDDEKLTEITDRLTD